MKLRRFGACILAVSMLCSLPVYAEEIGETESAVNMETPAETVAESEESESESVPVSEVQEETEKLTEGTEETEKLTEGTEETEKLMEETAETTEDMEAYKQTGVEGFVYRLYKLVLNREPEAKGYNEWVGWL